MVLGPDVGYSGPNGQNLAFFRIAAGNLGFPLLRDCGDGFPADSCLLVPYNERDNYVVIDRTGIIRYHADDHWDYGSRYHVDELRGCIDALLAQPVDAPGPAARGLSLSAAPSPFARSTAIELSSAIPGATHARIAVHDAAGRRIALLWDGALPMGRMRVEWEGTGLGGAPLAPGIYLVTAEVGGTRLTRRVVRAR